MSFDKLNSYVVYECGISNRINARSISWNSSGTTLAMAGSDRTTRLYTMSDLMSSSSSSSSSSVRELSAIAGHTGTIDRVRFHPNQDSLLVTASGSDATVRLWDLRSSSSVKSAGKIELVGGSPGSSSNRSSVDVSWSPSAKVNQLVVTEKNGNVHVVDIRKLGGSASSSVKTPASPSKRPASSAFRKTFALRPKIIDACVFSPSGDHLVAATSEEGYGELTVWNWQTYDEFSSGGGSDLGKEEKDDRIPKQRKEKKYVYPAHTGPIYSFCFSPNGRKLATGGGDALVGLWDVDTMVCSSTITRCDRFVRSVSFSFDSQIVATSTEEASIDLANADTGALVGKASMASNNNSNTNTNNNAGGGRGIRSVPDRNTPGADEIAFHPRAHLLACARCDSGAHSPLTIVKLTLGRQ